MAFIKSCALVFELNASYLENNDCSPSILLVGGEEGIGARSFVGGESTLLRWDGGEDTSDVLSLDAKIKFEICDIYSNRY